MQKKSRENICTQHQRIQNTLKKDMKGVRSILLVDQNKSSREELAVKLRNDIGCVVLEASAPEETTDILENENVSLLITDLFMPSQDGIELLKKIHKDHPDIATIAIVPSGNRELITEVLQMGTYFYINAPYDLDEAVIAASRGLDYYDFRVHKERRGPKLRKAEGFYGIIGNTPQMLKLFELIEKVADDDVSTVLIQGESGTGKELVAQAIHTHSRRRGKNIVPVNCTAIPDELLESELFGYVKGAFTGANQSKMGRIQYADGGTLFLDEIGDMKPALQAKLLRVIQEKEFEPVGGLKAIPVDVRIIAATHCNLEEEVAEGNFREDLYYRLSVVPLTIPPLRDRREDIPLLLEKFVQIYNRNKKKPLLGFGPDALEALMGYQWRGNVRELENLTQHMSVLHGGKKISLAELPDKFHSFSGDAAQSHTLGSLVAGADNEIIWKNGEIDFNSLTDNFERSLILKALSMANGNKKEAAKLLNLKRTTLLEKIKKKDIAVASLSI
jgi:DNA-binding NtrC family response regulator